MEIVFHQQMSSLPFLSRTCPPNCQQSRAFIIRSQLLVLKHSGECVLVFICHEAKANSQFTNRWWAPGFSKRRVGTVCSKVPQYVVVEWEDIDHLVDNCNVELPRTVNGACRSGLLLSCTIRRTNRDYAVNKNTWAIADTFWTVSVDPEKHGRHYSGKNIPH